MLIGIHTSISGGYSAAIEEGEGAGAEAVQIFVRQNLSWNRKVVTEEEAEDFRRRLETSVSVKKVVAHSSYLINLASDNRTTVKRSVSLMAEELLICKSLGIDIYVMHPGSHKGYGVEVGIQKIIDGLKNVRDKTGDTDVRVAFETTAGSGGQIGSTLDEIAEILTKSDKIINAAVCIDTAHLFGAGYNINDNTEYERLIREIDSKIGVGKVLVCHLNDSKAELATRKDRHEHIGKGKIDISVFRTILKDLRLGNAIAILETPKEMREDGISYDSINIELLKSLRDG